MTSIHIMRLLNSRWRLGRLAVALLAGLALAPLDAQAQVVVGGDFDINDAGGTLRGNTAFIRGRSGFGTDRNVFVLINGANDAQDVDKDGFTPASACGTATCADFTNLFVSDTSDFINVSNPNVVISRQNFVLADFLNPLRNGFANQVGFYVNIPPGTPAGVYRGQFFINDAVKLVGANPNGEALRSDLVNVEIEVLPDRGIGLVPADTAGTLDSLVLRGRPGQTVNGVARVANLGNVALANVRFDVTDLIATSGTGLRVRKERISFSPATITSIDFGDTARVVVTIRIPTGILAGSYRGDLIVQADDVAERRIPITLIVETPGDIIFESNPVRGRAGDLAVIIFNADPGTTWDMTIFDMAAIATFSATNTVTAGDQAVRFTWNLTNGRNEDVAGGMYYVIVNAVQDGRRRQIRGKLMVIR